MKLYFLRHGKAAESGIFRSDAERPLTAEGIEEMKTEAEALRRVKIKLDVILSSPLVRARQTAEIVAEILGCPAPEISPLLGPGFGLSQLQQAVAQQNSPDSIMFVGHEPDLSSLIGTLIGSAGAMVEMKKGSLALIDAPVSLRAGSGTLRWLVPPRLLI